jgi:hypothetical protein
MTAVNGKPVHTFSFPVCAFSYVAVAITAALAVVFLFFVLFTASLRG